MIKIATTSSVLVIACCVIGNATWAQQKSSVQPKQLIKSQPVQKAKSRVTFSGNLSTSAQSAVSISSDNLPDALTPEQRQQVIQEARRVADIDEKPTLRPNPPAEIILSPLAPKHGNSWAETFCMSGLPQLDTPLWVLSKDHCKSLQRSGNSMARINLKYRTIPSKRYLLDISVKSSKKSGAFEIHLGDAGAARLEIRDDHAFFAFVAKGSDTRFELLNVTGGLHYISKLELTRID